ncbi:bifunctional UDP-sugar hydrolase/5'-nucleotidase UshA [Shewanella surugensis]|uniref:Bifunctional UDP-sugar hydrolase/5'-nucleotidase UshA n=1 Tax=Shewanella surugensis TaxID=212020 RepID=A0ABT0LG70_9GAMM|nr:bifunctional UDP-sugar hydrolase/5'-nucleotidase UshA [Shewanella surugensis]MCL1126357.1 bifunctional UDP-sugar hydrolase/5'-nucleotidase UshA [Shewanella surugensis]
MNKKLLKGLVATAVLTALAGCGSDDDNTSSTSEIATSCVEAGDACSTFTLLHTNDNHGRFWENSSGEYGMAARMTLVEQIRSEVEANGGEVLLLSGGDVNTGVPRSDLLNAKPDFVGMNLIGYDAMAVGNHEFDNALDILEMQRDLADFPMLAANIYKDGERYFDAYKIFEVNGLRVAVIGLTTEDTVRLGNPEYISELEFTDPTTEVAKVITEINAANAADVIFATTHMGHYANGASGSNAPGDVAMARKLEAGLLDGIIGGHSQNPVCMEAGTEAYADFSAGDECAPDQQNGIYIMQAHEWGKYVGRADFEYYEGELHLASYQLVPVNLLMKVENEDGSTTKVLVGDKIEADPVVQEILRTYQDQGSEELLEVIAITDGDLEGVRDVVRSKQTNLGQLIAEAQRSKAEISADFAVMNSGGVRASIEAGEVTYEDVLTVQPFGNTITKNTLTGQEIADYLGTVASFQIGSGAYPQLKGISMTVDCTANTVDISDINGKGFSLTESYTFTVPSYNAAGGDGYPALDAAVMTGYVDADVLYDFFKAQAVIAVADYAPTGDVVYTNSDSVEGCQVTAG